MNGDEHGNMEWLDWPFSELIFSLDDRANYNSNSREQSICSIWTITVTV